MIELVDGEYYWLRPNNERDGELVVGRYNAHGWTHPIFDLCGDDYIHYVSAFDVISKVERPNENSINSDTKS